MAANRDEYLERPAEAPQLRVGAHGVALAPLDLQAGGTWLGISSTGLFAAVTNRPCAQPDAAARSRGLLVFDALAAGSLEEAAQGLERLPQGSYNPFNLFVADRRGAFVITYDDGPTRIDLEPGVQVIGNADPLAPPTPKLRRLRDEAEHAAAQGEQALDELAALCRRHAGNGNPLASTCVHTPAYGTRSSALLRLSEFATDDLFLFAEGPPCRTDYEDQTPLLHALGGSVQRAEGDRVMRTPR